MKEISPGVVAGAASALRFIGCEGISAGLQVVRSALS